MSSDVETAVESSHDRGSKEELDGEPKANAMSADPNVVEWEENDPENPLNWPAYKAVAHIVIISFMTLTVNLAATMFAPAASDLAKDFGITNSTVVTLTVSIYLLGFTFGPLMIAPLSELHGRYWIYNVCNLIILDMTIGCAKAPNLGRFMTCRFLAGIAGSAPLTIGGGTIEDVTYPNNRAKAMVGWALGPLLGPVLGPIAGGFISADLGWRWTFWIIAILSGVNSIICVLFMRETYAPTILAHRAARLRKETGNKNLLAAGARSINTSTLILQTITKAVAMLFTSTVMFVMSLFNAFAFGLQYLLFTTFPQVFEGQYNFSSGVSGLSYIGVGTGMFIGLFTFGIADKTINAKNATPKPESRLVMTMVATPVLAVGLFWYGWSAKEKVHWIVPMIGTAFVGFGIYYEKAASALAALAVFRSLFAAFLPLAGPPMVLPPLSYQLSSHGQDAETPSPRAKITYWMVSARFWNIELLACLHLLFAASSLPCRIQKIKCDETQPCCQQCYKRNRACNISSSRFRVYHRTSDPDPGTTQKPSKPPEPYPVHNNCHYADDDNISTHGRSWNLPLREDNVALSLDVSAEMPTDPSPMSNAVYDAGCILAQLASPPTVHLSEAQPHMASVATTPDKSGTMSSPTSNSMAVQPEVPGRDFDIPEASDFIISPSTLGTDDSLLHLPAMVATHALTPSEGYTNARGVSSANLIDQKSEIIQTDPELSFFLRQFADTMGNWMDLFDMDQHYHRVIPILAWTSPLLLYSACAVAAKQLTLVEPCSQAQKPRSHMQSWQTNSHKDFAWYSTKYYDRAISLLLRYVSNLSQGDSGQETAEQQNEHDRNPKPCRNEIIIAATILSVYEFLTASDQTWSEHLDGIRSFIRLSDELGFSFQPTAASPILDPLPLSLLRAACWNFARQDFLAALINGHKTRLDTENPVIWRRMGLSVSEDGRPTAHVHSNSPEDMYSQALRPDIISNTLIWLLSKLANYVALATDPKQQANSTRVLEDTWLSLSQDFGTWHQGLPSSFRPSYRVPYTSRHGAEGCRRCRHQPESLISYETWYSSSMCASSMQSYHMSQILLLIHKPESIAVPVSRPSASGSPTDALKKFNLMNRVLQYHATEICAIALSRPEEAARIHMLQPVYLAGRCLHTKADRAVVLRLLESIETELGWSSRYRVKDLLEEWGMGRNEIMDCCN
ncbi:major facilitator superfamily transporter [Fusarium denticulatum]|uniref:Major facilitator superfamily transporter n=1 Tax=Fusarium denticulatum TaxID=48507 RepID=A0A8H5UB47_9HYPO|nr:major facilitator superfamily transporter [Fusarium denticulatum]